MYIFGISDVECITVYSISSYVDGGLCLGSIQITAVPPVLMPVLCVLCAPMCLCYVGLCLCVCGENGLDTKAVELTASQNLSQKRTGYLTAALTLSPNHEFRFMLVNQMQRDLSSSNMLEAAAALTALCKLGEWLARPFFLSLLYLISRSYGMSTSKAAR